MIDLFINGQRVDLLKDDISITFQSAEIGALSTRSASYTNDIFLPLTVNNVKVFEFLGIGGSNTNLPYFKTKCKLLIDGVEKFSDGYALIRSFDNGYKLNLFDGVKGLDDILNDKTVSDLNWGNTTINGITGANLNHYLTYSTISNSLTNSSGYIYFPYSRALYSSLNRPCNTMLLGIFYKTIFSEIFRQNGLTFSCDFFNTDTVTNLVVAPSTGWNIPAPTVSQAASSFISLTLQKTTEGIYDNLVYAFEAPVMGSYIVNLPNIRTQIKIFNTQATFFSNKNRATISLRVNGVTIYSKQLKYLPEQYIGPTSSPWSSYDGGETIYLDLRQYDSIQLWVTFDATNLESGSLGFNTVQMIAIGESELIINSQTWSVPINFSEILGDTKQIDFVKDAMTMFGLVMINDQVNSSNYIFKRLEDVLKDYDNAIDWSKYIVSQDFKYEYSPSFSEINAKRNSFSYIYEDESVTEHFGSSLVIQNDNISQDSGTIYSSIFTITKPNTEAGYTIDGLNIADYPLFVHLFDLDNENANQPYKPYNSTLKLFYCKKDNTYTLAPFQYELNAWHSSITIPTNTVPYSRSKIGTGTEESIYAADILAYNYSIVNDLLNKYKRLTVKMIIPVLEISKLNFSKLIYLKYTGRYYYLNRIIKYKVGKPCDVELFELPIND